jgi:hypothetical protein
MDLSKAASVNPSRASLLRPPRIQNNSAFDRAKSTDVQLETEEEQQNKEAWTD